MAAEHTRPTFVVAQPVPLGAGSAEVGQWEQMTLAAAGSTRSRRQTTA
jgi:hypothetical protein